MTEYEWLEASEPHAMLAFLRGSAGARPLRLFAVACSRRIWDLMDDLGRAAVEAAERFADDRLGPDEMRAARLACQGTGRQASWYAAATNPEIAARNAARSAQAGVASHPLFGTETDELFAQASLLRDIFGNPHRPIVFDPAWRTRAVVEMAQRMYDDRVFDRMPDLAALLAEAGCDHDAILDHCLAPGPHVRGCWVVDLVLGKR